MCMKRTTVFLDETLLRRAHRYARRRGISFAELVRRAVAGHLAAGGDRQEQGLPSIAGKFDSGGGEYIRAGGRAALERSPPLITLADTGAIYALLDRADDWHERVVAWWRAQPREVLLPVTILPEVTYLLQTRIGAEAEHAFVRAVADHGPPPFSLVRPRHVAAFELKP